jgi:hypothetical protein
VKIKKQKYWYANCDIYVSLGQFIEVEYNFAKCNENKFICIKKQHPFTQRGLKIDLPYIPQRVDEYKMKEILIEAKKEKYDIDRNSLYATNKNWKDWEE